jgi:hypothetical protein
MITTVGNPSIWPTGIRTPTGTDPRNATTEAALATDAANGLAWLRAHTVDRMHNTIADLQAATGVSLNEPHYVLGYGWYWYTPTMLALQGDYMVITATGMGSGRWVSDVYSGLTEVVWDGTARLKRHLQQNYIIDSGTCFSETPLATGTIAAGASLLDTVHIVQVDNTITGDIIDGVFGPLLLSTPSTTNPGFRGRVDVECVSGYTTGGGLAEVCRSVTVGILGGYIQTHEISWRGVVTTPGTTLIRMRFTAPDDVTFAATCMDRYWYGKYEARRQ